MAEWIAFTGDLHLTPDHEQYVEFIAKRLPAGSRWITGAAIGLDAFIARLGQKYKHTVHTVVPANRSRVDPDWRQYATTWHIMPDDTDYRARNTKMIDVVAKAAPTRAQARLIAFPMYEERDSRSSRSGTWMTVRIARRAGLVIDIHVLSQDHRYTEVPL